MLAPAANVRTFGAAVAFVALCPSGPGSTHGRYHIGAADQLVTLCRIKVQLGSATVFFRTVQVGVPGSPGRPSQKIGRGKSVVNVGPRG